MFPGSRKKQSRNIGKTVLQKDKCGRRNGGGMETDMIKRLIAAVMAFTLTTTLFAQSAMAGIEIPDLGELASEAMSGIEEAADAAGEAAAEAAEKAGTFLTDTAQQAGETASGWAKYAGETADRIKQSLEDAGVSLQITAEELGKATVDTASVLIENAGKAADDAISAVSDAGSLVVDRAGHVVDMAEAGAGYVTDAAESALQILQEKGGELMEIAQKAVEGLDLSKEENWERARSSVEAAIDRVYENGMLLGFLADRETVRTVTNIIFSTLMYGWQFAGGQITLAEYAAAMSDVIIREGLPLGVGIAVRMLPFYLPHADEIAKEAVTYLISLAFEDRPGEEIEAEEVILEEAS